MDYKLLKLLKDKMVADAYQYYVSCAYKLHFAQANLEALSNVVTEYQAKEKAVVKKVYADAAATGKGSYSVHKNSVDYLGVEMGATEIMDMLTMEIFGLLHNFFDTFAQWINAGLFAEDAIEIKKVTLASTLRELPNFPEYTGNFITDLLKVPYSDIYLYISDFNNILKHRYQIYIENSFDFFSLEGSVTIPPFAKDRELHIKKDALTYIDEALKFCQDLLSDSRNYIQSYYESSDNLHVQHRVYNPKTFLLFETIADYKKMESHKNHYYYIEVDSASILDEYQVLLSYDRMDKTEDKRIKCFNSPYEIIMLREIGTDNKLGILKPMDGKKFAINNEYELHYRKYIPILTDYEFELFNAICSKDTFHYYPLLSEVNAIVLDDKEEK